MKSFKVANKSLFPIFGLESTCILMIQGMDHHPKWFLKSMFIRRAIKI